MTPRRCSTAIPGCVGYASRVVEAPAPAEFFGSAGPRMRLDLRAACWNRGYVFDRTILATEVDVAGFLGN
jgi:hypothetical protein